MGFELTARFGPFTLHRQQRHLRRDRRDVHLTPKAFDLLVLLIDESPRVVPKKELHERLWPDTFVSDATLVGLVKELRRALDDRDPTQPLIRTVTRVGYGFAARTEHSPTRPLATSCWLIAGDKRFPLQIGDNTIGRDPASAVWLDGGSVSRRHARIMVGDAGATIEDLESKNGTKVGEVRVTKAVSLKDGDRLTIGTVPVIYRESTAGLSTETQVGAARVEPEEGRSRG